ncbi:MAG TPA: LysR family transcriptional regulator [Acetobacteraceae bacterium]|nr:LysR family transcriptional regulator [Acetobacteraceae bacterium]
MNLLLVFDALYAERSVTRAGHRLSLTQSAVSHALGRLRDRLGDELFVKGGDGMMPTARARAIARRVRSALAELQTALADTQFDPAVSDRCFSIAADPYARAILLPGLIAGLRQRAPGVELRIKPGFAGLTEALDSGELDFAIACYRQVPERFGMLELLEERHVWAMRQDHPAAGSPLTLDRLAALPHLVRVFPGDEEGGSPLPDSGRGLVRRAMQDDDGAFARALAGIGRQRSVRLTIPDSYAALAIVGETDLAALVPARMGQALAPRFGLRLFDPPYPSPSLRLSMVWELGQGASPDMAWMRALIQETAREIDAGTVGE